MACHKFMIDYHEYFCKLNVTINSVLVYSSILTKISIGPLYCILQGKTLDYHTFKHTFFASLLTLLKMAFMITQINRV